jgi:FAD/FMN-containing dehydrogenase
MSFPNTSFTGQFLRPADEGYDEARRVWNGMIDRRPLAIARCRDAGDVSQVLRYAATAGVPVTVRGGGHNVAGTAIADGAILIDLSPMRAVTVDRQKSLAQAGGGALLRDVDGATVPLGLACPAGVVSHTGLGGLALGGGYGWLCRKWSLTCDHIVGAEVVLADGDILDVTEESHPDLVWGLRGGGGNFGVVTRFTLRLRPVGRVAYRSAVWRSEDAPAALAAFGMHAPAQSDDSQILGALKYASSATWLPADLHGTPVLGLSSVWFGDPESSDNAADAAFATVPPAAVTTRVLSFADLQAMGDESEPPGWRYYTKSCYLCDVGTDTAEALAVAMRTNPSHLSTVDLGFLGGAIARVDPAGTAFPSRSAPFMCAASAAWLDPAGDQENIAWSRATIAAMSPWADGGAYVNYMQHEPSEVVAALYGADHHRRLVELKNRYDPTNVFRGNQNISPTTGSDLGRRYAKERE